MNTEDAITKETGMGVFELWAHRYPDAPDTDPRVGGNGSCQGDECQTFAWYGYGGLCGWCYELQINPFVAELVGQAS